MHAWSPSLWITRGAYDIEKRVSWEQYRRFSVSFLELPDLAASFLPASASVRRLKKAFLFNTQPSLYSSALPSCSVLSQSAETIVDRRQNFNAKISGWMRRHGITSDLSTTGLAAVRQFEMAGFRIGTVFEFASAPHSGQ